MVIDISTRLTMVGFAGEDRPRFTFPTVVGYDSTDGDFTAEQCIGQALFESIIPRLVYPVKAGLIEDWNALEAIYSFAFSLLEVSPSKTRVLVTENIFNPREYKERITQMLFHDFGVSHLIHAPRQVLTVIAVRSQTGIAIDFEPDYVSIVPVYEELSISHATEVFDPPATTGLEIHLIAKQIVASIEKVDSGIQDTLCSNIVLTGSSTTTPKFEEALLEELTKTSLSERSFKIIASPERLYLPWIGGSILANR